MITARDMVKRLQSAESKIESDVKVILKMLESEILDINRNEQLFEKGLGTDGRLLGVYSKATQEMTEGIQGTGFPKRAGSPYNFYDTGEMFKSFDLRVGKDSFSIFNTSRSLKEFSRTKGISEDRIIGLTAANEIKVNFQMIAPILREFFIRNIG
ncbi:MAG: hypothetical protein AAF039_12810 [Bacteroidota bacterium]